ncbi:DegT/DnrJ/EryC1/StrS family aminotransferase [Halobacterium zhouii]|uniref:DegT/DnrJ/EryC1/StrS family aminotransferase n=1 Tax=Halobacterium zhouii TaxID=2902624 RepID=UPI001E585741|nr:DegT/DnrJ/EryC1/StrS family aminotransferase [Halobacterium zhouii]
MSTIPIADPRLDGDERERVIDVLDGGQLADGPEVRAFEDEFADYCDADHGVATSNGTTALHAMLRAAGVGPGDRVVTTPFTFVATANAVRHVGAEPLFVDVDPETYNIDPYATEDLIRRLDGSVDAILAVHLFGLPANMGALREVADTYDCTLLADACQAHGAEYDGRRVGTHADAACFSFYPTKNMTTGEGGMVTTDDEGIAARTRSFIDHGRTGSGTYDHADVGHNFRMTSVAAAIGRAQLEQLPGFVEDRRANAAFLTDLLRESAVTTPHEPRGSSHVYNQYTVRSDDRDGLREHLEEADVDTAVYYPTPVHQQPAYSEVAADVPVAERLADEVVSLPVHPGLSGDDLERVANAVTEYGER